MAVKCILTGQEKVNLSGDTMTGDLKVGSSSIGTNGYIEGTWLKTTAAGDKAGDFATIDNSGWIYKRKPADVLGDIGGQSKITANGILKGDGTGAITAADETEVELVDLPQEIVWVKYTKTDSTYTVTNAQEILEAYKQGNKIIALRLEITEHGMYNTCIMYLNTVKSAYIVSNRNYYFQFFAFELEKDVNTDSTSIYPYYNALLFIQEADGTLNDSLTNLSVYNKAQLPGPMYTKSISLPAASWTGADPYTQEVNISSIATAKTRVDIQPSEIIYDQLVADSVGYLAIKNDNGTFTAIAKGGKPSIDLALQITYTNNNYYM